jgi:ferredoxin--NADP+ reductase
VREVHVLVRRGPAHAAWTSRELRELGELRDVDIIVEPNAVRLTPGELALVEGNRALARNVEIVADWAAGRSAGRSKLLYLHFWTRPVEILGTHIGGGQRLAAVRYERTSLDSSGKLTGTAEFATLEADLLVRAVGYFGAALAGVPFDADRGVIPNVAGRVLRDRAISPGEYVAGWIKRGPSGVIGSNKKDARETAAAMLADAPALLAASGTQPSRSLRDELAHSGVTMVDLAGWNAIDRAEIALGQRAGRPRTTLHERAALLAAAENC